MKKSIVTCCLLFTILFNGNSIYAQSDSKLLKKSIEIGKAKEVRTDISFFSGELFINSETDALAKCIYGYRDGFLRPDMTYREVGSTGYLSVESEENKKGIFNDDTNKWCLSLNKSVKNNVSIQLKAGDANIDL